MTSRPSRRAWRAVPLVAAALGAACDLPSKPPILQQTWVVPGDSIDVNVSQMLPASVSVAPGGAAFLVSVAAPAPFASTLGALCAQPACQSGGTVNAPVPAFTSPANALTRTVSLPADAPSVTVTGGQLWLSITNTLGFDPLRPNGAAAPYGSVAITITNGANSATTTLTGATQALANGATTAISVPVPTGAYAASFSVSVSFTVPAGQNADLASSNGISVSASISGLTVSQATVVVSNEAVNVTPSAYDLEDVDFADQVEGGGLLLDVANPFTATAALSVLIEAPQQGAQPAVSISKPVNIPATPTSTATVTLSKAELQSLVGRSGVTIAVSGTANGTGAGNTVVVQPGQVIRLHTRVQLLLNMGA